MEAKSDTVLVSGGGIGVQVYMSLAYFRRLAEPEKLQTMVDWFSSNYEDPVHSMPYEGGYVWICELHIVDEVLHEMFEDYAPEELIEAAITEIGPCSEWVSVADLKRFDDEGRADFL